MRKIILLLLILSFISPVAVKAAEYTAPDAPESAQKYMPEENTSFSDGLWYIIRSAINDLQPSIAESSAICAAVIAATLFVSIMHTFDGPAKVTVSIVSAITIAALLMQTSSSMITLASDTVRNLSEYGKLLLPVMTGALAAQGGVTTSAALYAGTLLFNTLLTSLISGLLIPMVYFYIALSVANNTMPDSVLKGLSKFLKWLITWILKIVLYTFIGYIGITGVVSGSADAMAIKATKIAISGAVPVVGSIISDASETILVSAGLMKNAAGITGMLAIIAVWIGPFLKIGIQYTLLKLTGAICGIFGSKQSVSMIKDFSVALGFMLAMTGSVSLLHIVSTVCFMKGLS